MITATLWLLMYIGDVKNPSAAVPVLAPAVIERFQTKEECTRVQEILLDTRSYWKPVTRCIQATVILNK